MARSRKSAAAGTDPRPIVTYSHVPPEAVDERVEPHALDPDVAIIDAVEVPLVEDVEAPRRSRRAPDLRATDHDGPDLRADPRDDSFGDDVIAAAAFDEPPRRRRGGRLLFLVALIAIAGGAGAIAASLGAFAPAPKAAAPVVATDPAAELIAIHKQIDALGDASSPEAQAELARLTKRLAELEQSGAFVSGQPAAAADAAPATDIGPAVRQISLTPDGASEPAKPAAPPAPRIRPEKPAATEAAIAPDEDLPVAEPIFPRPVKQAPKAAAVPRAAPPAAGAAPGDDGFIASVEKALADSEGNKPGRPAPLPQAQPMGDAGPMVLGAPPQPLRPPPMASVPASEPPPAALTPAAAPLPPADSAKLDADAADPYALPAPPPPLVTAEPQPALPPGMKLPPADIPNVPGSGDQY